MEKNGRRLANRGEWLVGKSLWVAAPLAERKRTDEAGIDCVSRYRFHGKIPPGQGTGPTRDNFL